jgi:hypothetical protein
MIGGVMIKYIVNGAAFALFTYGIYCLYNYLRRDYSDSYEYVSEYDSDSSEDQYAFQDSYDNFREKQQLYGTRRRSPRLAHHYRPNYPYVLIIIDMQDQFEASRNKITIHTIQRLITEAKRDGAFILAAHYMRFGKTRPEIRSMITDYAHMDYCYADQNDKSGAIRTKILRHQIRTDTFKICGVNTGACVKATVGGLISMYPNIHILLSNRACNCNCGTSLGCGGHEVGRYSNVSFIY